MNCTFQCTNEDLRYWTLFKYFEKFCWYKFYIFVYMYKLNIIFAVWVHIESFDFNFCLTTDKVAKTTELQGNLTNCKRLSLIFVQKLKINIFSYLLQIYITIYFKWHTFSTLHIPLNRLLCVLHNHSLWRSNNKVSSELFDQLVMKTDCGTGRGRG